MFLLFGPDSGKAPVDHFSVESLVTFETDIGKNQNGEKLSSRQKNLRLFPIALLLSVSFALLSKLYECFFSKCNVPNHADGMSVHVKTTASIHSMRL